MSSLLQLSNSIKRIDISVSLNSFGVLTYNFGKNGNNSLSEFLMHDLYSKMRNDAFDELFQGLSRVRKERKKSFIYLTSEKGFKIANSLIAKVNTKSECTILIKCLYTDDSSFDVSRITDHVVYDEFMFNRLSSGQMCYISPMKTYVFKVVSERYRGNFTEKVIDYVIYIPKNSLR